VAGTVGSVGKTKQTQKKLITTDQFIRRESTAYSPSDPLFKPAPESLMPCAAGA
jgi:hypothetical protein